MRTGTVLAALAALSVTAACAGSPGAGSAGPSVLAFQVPSQPTLSYAEADTAIISVDAGGQMVDIQMLGRSVVDMSFAPSDAGVRVTATWRELEATVTNPMGPAERMNLEDVDGSLVFDMDRRGAATLVSGPSLRGIAANMWSNADVVHGFFPRLPGGPPAPGMTWTDTISFEEEEEAGPLVARSILTYTVAGDTVVDGRSLLKVDLAGDVSRTQEGVTSGMSFVQDLAGTLRGHFLWDLGAGALHSQVTLMEVAGTMDVAAVPFPLDVSMRGVTRVYPAESR